MLDITDGMKETERAKILLFGAAAHSIQSGAGASMWPEAFRLKMRHVHIFQTFLLPPWVLES